MYYYYVRNKILTQLFLCHGSKASVLLDHQGLDFTHRFFEQITLFLLTKQRFAHEKEQIAPVALLSWATRANQ